MPLLGNEVVIATKNAGKAKEFAALFERHGLRVRTLADYPSIPDIPEDGDTFTANALIKAQAVAKTLGVPVVADDSGLCVDRLDGAPGVYSARYAGEPASDEANNRKLLAELSAIVPTDEPVWSEDGTEGLSTARFVSAIVLVDAGGEPVAQVEGECGGIILARPRGTGGFGYDPLFYVPQLGKTLAELSVAEKNAVSHRGRALAKLWDALDAAG